MAAEALCGTERCQEKRGLERLGGCEKLDGEVFLCLGGVLLANALQLEVGTAHKIDFPLAVLFHGQRESGF